MALVFRSVQQELCDRWRLSFSRESDTKAQVRLTFEQRTSILEWFWKLQNINEMQRRWRKQYGTEISPTGLSIASLRDKFEAIEYA
ncbi:hypothetical protein TNCV_2499931 [Trichonephila clavipes]|nr:hypothetical protein TNCV_2499931 [Trichonephila clavipes]